MLPKARRDSIIVQELADETLVYDHEANKAHCLNPAAAVVWKHCDGKTTVGEISRRLHDELGIPADDDTVWLALERLDKSRLLAEPLVRRNERAISRRDLGRRLGLAGGLAVALPLVTSIIAPTPAEAVSCKNAGKALQGVCCGNPKDCCSDSCNPVGPNCIPNPGLPPSTKQCN